VGCAEPHGRAHEVAEARLAHVAGGVERAYFRSDIIDIRREVLNQWADLIQPPAEKAKKVVPIKKRTPA
jgi:hypothetical protein